MSVAPARRVLIYRLGSLGDTVVALPTLRLIARAFPDAERWILTNFSINSKAAPVAQVLDGTGLIHGYIEYPVGVRSPRALMGLRDKIRQIRPETLVYLAEARSLFKTVRDALFFKACGIRQLIGVPYTADMRTCRNLGNDMFEYEGARLARCVRELGDVRFDEPTASDLNLSAAECDIASSVLEPRASKPLLGVSVGAKVDVKDWGDKNWSALLSSLSERLVGWGLVTVGADVERNRSDALLKHWHGASLNLCGQLRVRESAAVLEHCRLFIGHDSGPMHLAAAVGTPCVAIFSGHNLPGIWFPHGNQHKVIYHNVPCRDCRLDVCEKYDKRCIRSITVAEVLQNVLSLTERCTVRAGEAVAVWKLRSECNR